MREPIGVTISREVHVRLGWAVLLVILGVQTSVLAQELPVTEVSAGYAFVSASKDALPSISPNPFLPFGNAQGTRSDVEGVARGKLLDRPLVRLLRLQ